MIDTALTGSKDFDAFLAAMKAAGAEVKRGKYLAFKIPGAERFIRCKSIGGDYTEDALRERISGKRVVAPKQKKVIAPSTVAKPNMLIDIQAKLQQGYGEGYRQWATGFNLKTMSKNLIFLQERGLTDYDVLVEKVAAATETFNNNNERRKAIEARLKEITELQKHIGAYGKTLDIYKQYRALTKQKCPAFFAEHSETIKAHRAAKEYFDSQGYGENKKLPTMNMLKKGWATLTAEKSVLSKNWKQDRGMK